MSEIITVRALSSSPSTATTSNFLLDRRMGLAGSGLFDGGEGAMTPNPSLRRRSRRSFTLPDCGLLASTQTIPLSGAERIGLNGLNHQGKASPYAIKRPCKA